MSDPMKPFSIRLGAERQEMLRQYCKVLDLEMSAVIRDQVDEWLHRMAPVAEPIIKAMEEARAQLGDKLKELEK